MTEALSTERYVLERVQEKDLRAVMRLAWRERSPPIPGPFFVEAARKEGERFRVVRDQATDEVVGFVLTARLPLQQRDMLMLVVRPELVGLGLRRALLHSVERSLRNEGERQMTIEVPLQASDLLEFYRREGFEPVGRVNGQWGEELVLSAPLTA